MSEALNKSWNHLAAISENHWNARVKYGEDSEQANALHKKLLESARAIEGDFGLGIDDPNDVLQIKRWLDSVQLENNWELPEWESGLGAEIDTDTKDILKEHYIPPRPEKVVSHVLTSEQLMVFAVEMQGKSPEEIAEHILYLE